MADPLATGRGTLAVPAFLPDATRAGVRGASSEDLRAVGVEGVVVNAFHLLRRPGARVVQAAGGIHRFMDWDRPIVSDSGGFQIWSLIRQDPNRGVIRDNEVIFREPSTGEKWNLTPERIVEPPAPAGQRRGRLPRRLHRCGVAGVRTGALRRADRAMGTPLPRGARSSRSRSAVGRRHGSSPSSRAAGSRRCDGNAQPPWPRSASMATASAAGRSPPTARCSPSRCAGSSSRSRPRLRSTRSVSAGPITWSTPSRSATRCSTARFRPVTLAMAGSTRSATAGPHAGRSPATTSTAPSASTMRRTGSRTDQSRTAATARSAPVTRRPTCTTCSRSGTRSAERLATLHNLRFYVRLFALLRS